MSYSKNPFNSEAGKSILKENFRLVFAQNKKNPKDIEAKDLREITGHFVKNTEQIINNIMKFSKGHRPIPPADAFETGIYVCPHCLRRDFMHLWEFEYLGYYEPGSMGNKPLKFEKHRKGSGFRRDTYPSIARVKCNTVYSCTSCNTTYGSQPTGNRGRCDRCNGEDFRKVGCGQVSYAEHFTPSLTVSQLFSNPQKAAALTVNQNQHNVQANIGPKTQTPKPVLGLPTAFEYMKRQVNTPDMRQRSDYGYRKSYYESMNQQIPAITVAYSNKKLMVPNSSNCVGKPKVQQFPISPMRLLRWPPPKRFKCLNPSHRDYSDLGWRADFKLGEDLGTSYWCTARDEWGRQHGARYSKPWGELNNAMVPTITSPNPLSPESIQPKLFKGSPIYRITLEMRPRQHMDETYQYSLYLPGKFSLQPFMEDISEIPINQGGREYCPNDPIVEELIDEFETDAFNENDEFNPGTSLDKNITVQNLIDEGRTDVVDILTKYTKGIVKDEFTQITLEGCSERGVLMRDHYRGWVDYSSEVLNAAGDIVPRFLFLNKKEKEGREWLKQECKKLNDFSKGRYTFMNFGYTTGRYGGNSARSEYADHLFPSTYLSKDHNEEQLLPVLAGTPVSISTTSGDQYFSPEFWRKLRGVKLANPPKKHKTFVPIVTDGDTSFIPTYLLSRKKLPICTINGKITKVVQGSLKKLRPTHFVESGVTYLDDTMMTVYTVVRCTTCNDIFDAGGVLNFRSSQGWVNASTGQVTGNPRFYTQKAFDQELVHELAAGSPWEPFTTSDGFRVCPNWGIDALNKYGKAMLKASGSTGSGGLAQSMDVGVRGSGKKGKK